MFTLEYSDEKGNQRVRTFTDEATAVEAFLSYFDEPYQCFPLSSEWPVISWPTASTKMLGYSESLPYSDERGNAIAAVYYVVKGF